MAKRSDPLDGLTPEGEREVLRSIIIDMFGPARGADVWRRFADAMKYDKRQLGDAPEPEKNYWKGAWRIYEID